MIPRETVLTGAPHPGTPLQVIRSANGYYIGFLDEDGLPYSRETVYFPYEPKAHQALSMLNDTLTRSPETVVDLEFVRR